MGPCAREGGERKSSEPVTPQKYCKLGSREEGFF